DNVNRQSDWEYNRRKQEDQEEVDRILDKIRKSGYDSLSADEKRRLFESSKKN
ncbi:MAG: rhomboid family intramembrane serine protease, partial [Prevotella salivae]|nr:rhomboid family intramembrane serine protease [Segatella salivae]